MKNLFKNLMLVAVAAMAFTACTEENNEVNALSKKTTLEFVATFDETRSGFDEAITDENGTRYPSKWYGDETIKVFINGTPVETGITAEGKFNVEFEGETIPDFITVVSPASAWSGEYTFTIPAEQTPLANSVDPAAHILQAQNMNVATGIATMQHQAAYGKMTVNTPEEFTIDYVTIDLTGLWYGYDKSASYTINADNVENNEFWFTTEPINVTSFTVTAYDAEGNAYTKTVTIPEGRELSFNYGMVSKFSVSNLEASVEPAEPMFECLEVSGTEIDIVVKLYNEVLGELWINFYGSNCPLITYDPVINVGTYYVGYGLYFGDNFGQYKPSSMSDFLTGTPNYMTIDVSVVDGKYKFVINADYTNMEPGVVLENAVFIGELPGLQLPDTRTKLATPAAEASVVGKTITISWDAVEGADGYRVKLYSPYDYYFEEIVTGTEYVYEAAAYSTKYSFTIMSYASDENTTYKSSDDAYVDATTEKDPDVFATHMMSDVSNLTDYIQFHNGGSPAQVRVVLNNADRPTDANNKMAIKPGTYTFNGEVAYGDTLSAGEFYIQRYMSTTDTDWNMDSYIQSASMTVEYKNDQYEILITIDGQTFGFKGVGDLGIPTPDAGGDESSVQLTTPSASTTAVTENSITVTWGEVANASGYAVSINGGAPVTVNALTYTFENLEANTDYVITVVAKGNGAEWLDSAAATVNAKTEAAQSGGGSSVPEGYQAVNFVSVSQASFQNQPYSWMVDYVFDLDGANISFTICDFSSNTIDVPNKKYGDGIYSNNNNGANTDTKEMYNISLSGISGMSGSQVEITKDGTTYTFKITIQTNIKTYKLYYQGAIN